MPQRDVYHDAVRRALKRDGWTITHDPLALPFGVTTLYVDLGAEGPLGAERDGRKIAVEVKSFVGVSEVWDLEHALGQYTLYGFLLGRQEPDRLLYLAVPAFTYERLLRQADGRDLLDALALRIIVFRPVEEVIAQWIR
ncbi:MAG: element excision factor XisH family protein [Candidatus Xenobia bacterium]